MGLSGVSSGAAGNGLHGHRWAAWAVKKVHHICVVLTFNLQCDDAGS